MKKRIIRVLALLLIGAILVGAVYTSVASAEAEKIRIVTTIFPVYDWVRQILGDRCDRVALVLLQDSGADLHNYQPSAGDILEVRKADLFIYVGGESDDWVKGVLTVAENEQRRDINLLEILGENVRAEERVEGMEQEEEDAEEEMPDEHIWLSLRNADELVQVIAEAIAGSDPDFAEIYRDNMNAYRAQLEELDCAYGEAVEEGTYKTLLFGDRFPFRYMVEDYGLSYYAAFAGCSAETNASFETVAFLAKKMDEMNLPAVMTTETPKSKLAETIVQSTRAGNQQIIKMNSLQSMTAQDIEAGVTYLTIMTENLNALKQALQ